MTRRRVFAVAWLAWLLAFVVIEGAALLACGGDVGVEGCTLSAVWWRTTADPVAWLLGCVALGILGIHLASRGRW